jgi:hypothetical protein
MKRCPRCGQSYTDSDINFCLNDGELLSRVANETSSPFKEDPPPTVMMDPPRPTMETGWQPPYAPPAPWHGQQQEVSHQPFSQFPTQVAPNQTLAIVSLCLGIGSMTIGWCCSTGLVLSPAALITGFIALAQIKKDPSITGGRGFAIGGIVTAAVFLVLYILFIIIYGLAIIGGNIS